MSWAINRESIWFDNHKEKLPKNLRGYFVITYKYRIWPKPRRPLRATPGTIFRWIGLVVLLDFSGADTFFRRFSLVGDVGSQVLFLEVSLFLENP